MSTQTPAQKIAAQMINLLEQGVRPWTRPWHANGTASLPLRATGQPYRGINTVLLWMQSAAMGYGSRHWMTYRQAAEVGGQVRKGETGTMVVYYGTATDKRSAGNAADGDPASRYKFLKSFYVFNCDQIENLPEQFQAQPTVITPVVERLTHLDDAFARIGADIRHGGNQAFYMPSADFIQMPSFSQFNDPEQYYATLAHEIGHWTGSATRLSREFGKKFGDPVYAAEECCAEITACLVGSIAGLRPDHIHDHAAYLKGWIGALKDDPNFILKVAGLAQAAADYILERAHFEPSGAEPSPAEDELAQAA